MSRRGVRAAETMAHRLALILALELRLEGITADTLVALLGMTPRQAVALLEGHPSALGALPLSELDRLAQLAHLDESTLFRAAESVP